MNMNTSPLVQAVHGRLLGAGYSNLSTPFTVAGVEFPFTAAMRGTGGRALDLVLLVDTTMGDFGDRDGARVQQRVAALSRALDITGSRYVVSVILVGAMLSEGVEALSATCRVLLVDGIMLDDQGMPVDDIAKRQLDDRIRILLPLTLPDQLAELQDGSMPALEQLILALPGDMNRALLNAVITASSAGEQAVTDAVTLVINSAFQPESGEESS